jgi:drug/metabolite transporter (DMT)-like permease
MTRREFIKKLAGAGLALVAGVAWTAEKVLPRRFVRALKVKKYPGVLRPLGNVYEQSKWSG